MEFASRVVSHRGAVAVACGLDTVSGAVIGLGRVGKESRETLLAPESVRQRAKIIAHGRNLGNN